MVIAVSSAFFMNMNTIYFIAFFQIVGQILIFLLSTKSD